MGRGEGFEGEGHRLGGNEHPMKFGDAQDVSRHVSDSGTGERGRERKIFLLFSSCCCTEESSGYGSHH